MKRHCFSLAMFLLILVSAAHADLAGAGFQTRLEKTIPMDSGYLYDAAVPLEETVELKKETENYKQYRVTYVSVNDQVVPAWLIAPQGQGPFPVVMFMNGKGGNKDDILPFADQLTAEGYALFAADPQYHGERRRKDRSINGRNIFVMVRAIRQTVLDYRRGVDFLATRPEIDPDKILYMGGSMGGIIGAVVCGIETRIRACVLTVAGGPWTEMAKKNVLDEDAAEMDAFRKENDLEWKDIQTMLDPVDPVNFIGLISPRPLLMINGKNDILVPVRTSKILYEQAREPKDIWWLNYSHLLPYDEIIPDVLKWYQEQLEKQD